MSYADGLRSVISLLEELNELKNIALRGLAELAEFKHISSGVGKRFPCPDAAHSLARWKARLEGTLPERLRVIRPVESEVIDASQGNKFILDTWIEDSAMTLVVRLVEEALLKLDALDSTGQSISVSSQLYETLLHDIVGRLDHGSLRAALQREVAAAEARSPKSEWKLSTAEEASGQRDRQPCEPQPRFGEWAIGIEHNQRWHIFKRARGEWHDHGTIKFAQGRQANLLQALARGGGFLAKLDAIKLERPTYSPLDVDSIMALIQPELSKIGKTIRKAIKTTARRANPIPYVHAEKGWRAAIQIGYAVQEDRQHLGGEKRLRFKTRDELSGDEKLEY